MLRANLAAAFVVLAGLALAAILSPPADDAPSVAAVAFEEVSATGCPFLDGAGADALPPGHPRVEGDRRVPRAHPRVDGYDLALPPGHPPVEGRHRESSLPPGHPPVDGNPAFAPRFDGSTVVDT